MACVAPGQCGLSTAARPDSPASRARVGEESERELHRQPDAPGSPASRTRRGQQREEPAEPAPRDQRFDVDLRRGANRHGGPSVEVLLDRRMEQLGGLRRGEVVLRDHPDAGVDARLPPACPAGARTIFVTPRYPMFIGFCTTSPCICPLLERVDERLAGVEADERDLARPCRCPAAPAACRALTTR